MPLYLVTCIPILESPTRNSVILSKVLPPLDFSDSRDRCAGIFAKMWKPPLNFITLHYFYICSFGIWAMIVLYPRGNLAAIDAYFFGVSASTESGLNTVDVKDLKLYQQVFIYIVPIVTNLGFINPVVILVRLYWFRQRFRDCAKLKPKKIDPVSIAHTKNAANATEIGDLEHGLSEKTNQPRITLPSTEKSQAETESTLVSNDQPRITFAANLRDNGAVSNSVYQPSNCQDQNENDQDSVHKMRDNSTDLRRRRSDTISMSKAVSVDRAMSSMFVLGSTPNNLTRTMSRSSEPPELAEMSREELGGAEYRALKALLPITLGYFFGLHAFGVLCLLPWIHTAPAKYTDYLASLGQDKTWWAFYSSQTMVDNLGFTLTPDSMITFRDAAWPMLSMSFIAYAGNTFYPCFLRLFIWTMWKFSPRSWSVKDSLRFLLDHPRRCYTLLFPVTATWALAIVLIVLNFIDVLLIITLDLDNPEVTALPVGHRILAAIFQSASSRHTGTSSFNLANVNPAVQFSLLVMMYISIYPIAISIRMSGDQEEAPIGIYRGDDILDEERGGSQYLIGHMRNQLSFDLWYIFLGVFCICAAESKKIMDKENYAFSVFAIFFEVVSAYGNVGLSLGHPDNLTSLCGHFTVFGKVVICAMMIRGRHRGMPYALDRAINLPSDRLATKEKKDNGDGEEKMGWRRRGSKVAASATGFPRSFTR